MICHSLTRCFYTANTVFLIFFFVYFYSLPLMPFFTSSSSFLYFVATIHATQAQCSVRSFILYAWVFLLSSSAASWFLLLIFRFEKEFIERWQEKQSKYWNIQSKDTSKRRLSIRRVTRKQCCYMICLKKELKELEQSSNVEDQNNPFMLCIIDVQLILLPKLFSMVMLKNHFWTRSKDRW